MPRASRILPAFAAPAVLWQVAAGVGSRLWLPERAALVLACVAALTLERARPSTAARLAAGWVTVTLFWAGALEAAAGAASLLGLGLAFFPAAALAHGAAWTWITTPADAGPAARVVRGVALSAAVLGGTLLAAEGSARLVFGLHTYDTVSDDPGYGTCLFRGPDGRGLSIAGYRGRFVHREFPGVRVEVNDWGLRDDLDQARPPEPGEVPVIALGDSFAFGLGVPLADTFHERLEAADPRLLVYGAGVPGYGPIDARRMLEDLLTVVRPRCVVYALCEGNDFQDTAAARFGPLAPAPPPAAPPTRAYPPARVLDLVRRPAFWREACALTQIGSRGATGLPSVFMRHALSKRLPDERSAAIIDGVVTALVGLRDRCAELGAPFLVLLVPSFVQADAERFEHYVARRLGLDVSDFSRTAFHERLAALLAARNLAVVDPLPELEAAIAAGRECYHVEGHWNAEGHGAAARALHAPLQRALASSPAPPGGH
jgi:hypothetical protein